jgi:GntR family transcriptional regulator/MocR family aminotransferase
MSQLSHLTIGRKGANGNGRRVYDWLRSQIESGVLSSGARVASTRALAEELGVARSTVTAAYEQLAAEGYLSIAVGRAARVASTLRKNMPSDIPEAPLPGKNLPLSAFGKRVACMDLLPPPEQRSASIDFRYGAVASRDFPVLAWKRAYLAALRSQRENLYYASPEGDQALRSALQGYLRRARGLVCSADQILIVNGAQQAIDLCARLLLEPGSSYVFEDPGYLMARRCFEASGATLVSVPVDACGIDTAQLPADEHVRLVYVTPSHQFPLGGVLPISRRMELLRWAQRRNAWVIEDDYGGEFRYRYPPRAIDALQSIDTDSRVIYVGTFSKVLSPQLRMAYVVLPHALVEPFRKAKQLADRHVPMFEQRVLASLIDSGAYERHVRLVRRENENRRAALLDAIKRYLPRDVIVDGASAGLHIVLWLPFLSSQDEPRLVAAASMEGVGVYAVSSHFVAPEVNPYSRPAGLTLGYASLTLEQIHQGLKTLSSVIASLL